MTERFAAILATDVPIPGYLRTRFGRVRLPLLALFGHGAMSDLSP